MAFQEFLEIAEPIVMMTVAITGAFVAVLGLHTWRHRIRGEAEYELARRLLRAAYQLREEFRRVRSRMMLGGEIAKAFEEAGVDREEHDRQREVVYSYRWQFLQRTLNDLNVESLEAEVLWGPEVDELLTPLRECAGDLWAALHEYVLYPAEDDADRERVRELRRKIHGTGEDDLINARLEEAIHQLEEFLRPHLKLHRR